MHVMLRATVALAAAGVLVGCSPTSDSTADRPVIKLPSFKIPEPPRPTGGRTEVVGFYAKGCIAGARAVPRGRDRFVVIRPQRNRFYGHPVMVDFIQDLARRAVRRGETMLVADVSGPRGGPISGHRSHQVGLDADIRLLMMQRTQINRRYVQAPPQISMLKRNRRSIDRRRWSSRQVRLIRTAARDRRVERVFVNKVIKRHLCRTVRGDRSWLGKVLPWPGHDAHMHVRLKCPTGSPNCIGQPPVAAGETGCDALLGRQYAKRGKRRSTRWRRVRPAGTRTPFPNYRKPPKTMPLACTRILNGGKPGA